VGSRRSNRYRSSYITVQEHEWLLRIWYISLEPHHSNLYRSSDTTIQENRYTTKHAIYLNGATPLQSLQALRYQRKRHSFTTMGYNISHRNNPTCIATLLLIPAYKKYLAQSCTRCISFGSSCSNGNNVSDMRSKRSTMVQGDRQYLDGKPTLTMKTTSVVVPHML
jgi:hypothetical protein